MNEAVNIFCDGGSRGNPGKSACAFVVEEKGKGIYSQAKYLGIQTNNFAEYGGVLLALSWIKENQNLLSKKIIFHLDSELVAKQINGEYKIKNKKLKEVYLEIKTILESLSPILVDPKISFKNISREKNSKADFLVNKKLDEIS